MVRVLCPQRDWHSGHVMKKSKLSGLRSSFAHGSAPARRRQAGWTKVCIFWKGPSCGLRNYGAEVTGGLVCSVYQWQQTEMSYGVPSLGRCIVCIHHGNHTFIYTTASVC